MRAITAIALQLAVGILVVGCNDSPTDAGRSMTSEHEGGGLAVSASPTHALDLTCFAGPCEGAIGHVNVTANARPVTNAAPGFGFAVEGQFNIHGAPPNTSYLAERRVDFAVDGICTGASYLTFPIPTPGPLVLLTTSAGGAGAAHFTNQLPGFADNSQFDVTFRLIEDSPSPGATEIRTGCATVTVK